MNEVTIFSIFTGLLLAAAILLNLHLRRKESSRPFIDKSVANAGYAFFFFLVALFFTLVLLVTRAVIEPFPTLTPLWILLAIFCSLIAIGGAFALTNALEKDVNAIQKCVQKKLETRPQPKEWTLLPFSIVSVDADILSQSGAQLSNILSLSWYDKYSSIFLLIWSGLVVYYWTTIIVSFQFVVLAFGIILIISLSYYDIHVVQRSFAAGEHANTFLSTLLIGACFTFFYGMGFILLLDGIRMGIALARHRKTQPMTMNAVYINLDTFAYYFDLFIFIAFFLLPESSLVYTDPALWYLVISGVAILVIVLIYWVLIGRFISGRRFEFIGKKAPLLVGILLIVVFGVGLPFLLIGILQFFLVPLNATFKRWNEVPEKLGKKSSQPSKLKAAAIQTREKVEDTSSQKGVQTPRKTKEKFPLPAIPKSEKASLLQRLLQNRAKKGKEKLVRNPGKVEPSTFTGLLRDYSNDLLQILPASGSSLLVDPVKFAVYAEGVKELQLNTNGLAKKGTDEEVPLCVEYLGNLPDTMQNVKVFVSPFFLEELIQKQQALAPNVRVVLIAPPVDPTTISTDLVQDFLTKNQPNVSLEFIDPSQFDLEIYRSILLMFNPTLDVFRVAEVIGYMNSLKVRALLVPNVDWLFVQDLLVTGKIPAKNLSKDVVFILPAKDALPAKEEPKIPTAAVPQAAVGERAFANHDTPRIVVVRASYITTLTVFILILFAGIYFLLERVGLTPIIALSGGLPLSPGEMAIVFVLWAGAIIYLSLYLFFKISNIRLRGLI